VTTVLHYLGVFLVLFLLEDVNGDEDIGELANCRRLQEEVSLNLKLNYESYLHYS